MWGCATCRGFSAVFASLGAFVIPLWIPLLGDIVLAFTAVIPGQTCHQAQRASANIMLCVGDDHLCLGPNCDASWSGDKQRSFNSPSIAVAVPTVQATLGRVYHHGAHGMSLVLGPNISSGRPLYTIERRGACATFPACRLLIKPCDCYACSWSGRHLAGLRTLPSLLQHCFHDADVCGAGDKRVLLC